MNIYAIISWDTSRCFKRITLLLIVSQHRRHPEKRPERRGAIAECILSAPQIWPYVHHSAVATTVFNEKRHVSSADISPVEFSRHHYHRVKSASHIHGMTCLLTATTSYCYIICLVWLA